MASSELRRHCDTELSLGRRRPAPACANNPCGGLTVTATELQAMAILRVARRAVALEEEGPARRVAAVGGDGADSRRRRLSVRRSLELFLRQRREARCQQQLFAAGAAASPSSSSASSSCFTDSDS